MPLKSDKNQIQRQKVQVYKKIRMSLSQSRTVIITLLILFILPASINSQQPSAQPQSQQLPYTEDIKEFKAKKYNERLQVVVGCWLLSKEYLDLYKSDYLFFKDLKLKQIAVVKLVKACMKKITRKDAVLKITELVGKNVQPARKYEDIVGKEVIDEVFIEVSKLAVADYQQYEPINNDGIINPQAMGDKLNQPSSSNNQSTTPGALEPQTRSNQTSASTKTQILSKFDIFLGQIIKKYNQQFSKLISSKQGLRGKVQEELKKREKYYFGFIPASSFTHSVFLVTISLSMVFCCTCYKYYKMRSNEKAEGRKKIAQENQSDSAASPSNSRITESKRVARMTQLTMKKKNI